MCTYLTGLSTEKRMMCSFRIIHDGVKLIIPLSILTIAVYYYSRFNVTYSDLRYLKDTKYDQWKWTRYFVGVIISYLLHAIVVCSNHSSNFTMCLIPNESNGGKKELRHCKLSSTCHITWSSAMTVCYHYHCCFFWYLLYRKSYN